MVKHMSRGRPTVRTKQLVESILAQIVAGRTVADACEAEGLKYKTFIHWVRVDDELRARVLEARAEALRG